MTSAPLDLSGTWRAAVSDERLRRTYAEADFDDGDWTPVVVPGHWQRSPEFATCDGPVLHRHTFTDHPYEPGERAWLVFDGIFYQSDVWLDGAYLGDTEGYFFPHGFEITDQLAARPDHVVAVEVSCAPQSEPQRKRNLTGVFQDSDCIDARLNPGGIWAPVRVQRTGPVRIVHHRVICADADPSHATVAVRLVVDSPTERQVTLRTRVADVEHVMDHRLAEGENQIEWTVTVPDPELWWPHALGDQPLHDVTVAVELGGGEVSDRVTRRIGFRSVQLNDWILQVNGERMFVKGTNQGPTSYWLAEAGADAHRRDLELARDAGLDLIRVQGHVGRTELYDLADELGMLLWQDLPLQGAYHRSVRRQAVRQARLAVDALGHHPSVAVWCGHNEPVPLTPDLDDVPATTRVLQLTRDAIDHELPNYNRSILDRSITRCLTATDGSRPVVPHSGVLPSLPRLDGTDTHVYFGWYVGDERQFPAFCRTIPRLARFVSEFGAQAVPLDAPFIDPTPWPDLDWDELGRAHGLQKAAFDRYVPPDRYATYDEWVAATQAYQATVIRFHVETLRRLKYRPTGGFTQFCFADSTPAVTWSVLSADRRPKAAYDALAAACRPVIICADRLPAHLHPGDGVEVDVHVVSDLRVPITAMVATATLSWDGGREQVQWAGEVGADECVRVGTLEVEVPDHVSGALTLDLDLRWDGGHVTNSDHTTVIAGAHEH